MRIEDIDSDGEPVEELKSMRISSSDEDEFDDEEEVLVTLGFVEKPENSWSLSRQVFPSKAGGTPAWLDPVNLPSRKSCCCDICEEPLQFLIQIYAPISDKDSTFHRTLFVFMCPSMTCLLRDQHEQWKHGPEKPSRSVKVFRCQLPRSNAFYSCESPKYDGSDMPLGIGAPLCAWCRTWKGDKVCGRCRRARYCSEKHQVKHWREGHKLECQTLSALNLPNANGTDTCTTSSEMPKGECKTLWPEYKIIEDDESGLTTSDADEHSNSLMTTTEEMNGSTKSRMGSIKGDDDDKKSWAVFQERLARAPEQVLRYSRDERAQPLWPSPNGRPSKVEIPTCSYCRGAMSFEFQVLPQLLYYFGVKNEIDSLDWATIVVYTCSDSCEGSISYKEEFAWVQLNSQTT